MGKLKKRVLSEITYSAKQKSEVTTESLNLEYGNLHFAQRVCVCVCVCVCKLGT